MNKTALVTGASSGIGEATARVLAAIGYNLVITARRVERIQRLSDEIEAVCGTKVHALGFDIRDRKQAESAVQALPESFRNIDLLVNNAGLAAGFDPVPDGDVLDWERMIDTNVKGLLYLTRIVSRQMIHRGCGGHIVNIGSIAGTQVYEKGAVYCATKHAVHALTQGLRIDLLPYGIRVSEVRPGMVETEFSLVRFHGDRERAAQVYDKIEALTAGDIAGVVAWMVSLPPHVNVNDIEVTPVQQANAHYTLGK